MAQGPPHPDGGYQTDSSDTRFPYTNDILAGLLVGFLVFSTLMLLHQGQEIPMWLATADVIAAISAVIWAFGKGAFKEAATLVKTGPR